jgi:hypothetical protein
MHVKWQTSKFWRVAKRGVEECSSVLKFGPKRIVILMLGIKHCSVVENEDFAKMFLDGKLLLL